MTNLRFSQLRKILCLGAHADDIEIGCGGTLLRLLGEYPGIHVYWVVLSADEVRSVEARRSAQLYLQHAIEHQIEVKSFRESFFPYNGGEIKDFFHSLGRQYSPDLVLTHRRDDLHQDHRLVSDLTWNTFRNHLILEYEIPKYDGDLGRPNLFVTIDEATRQRKIDALIESFPSQREKPWFTSDTFASLMRIRGVESNSPTGLAEGFYCRKGVV
jgi:LmbE family N-acetylglucosaminyl deacetylase